MRAWNTETFKLKANLIYGDLYCYEKSIYIDNKTHLTIICKKHGEFSQSPTRHFSGDGCRKCSMDKFALKTSDFIQKAILKHGERYDYSKAIYDRNNIKLTILCKEHGEFNQTPNNHLFGFGCRLCGIENSAISRNLSLDEFISKSVERHGGKYDYSKAEYKGVWSDIEIICPVHGDFWQKANDHFINGCKKCGTESVKKKLSTTRDRFLERAYKLHRNRYDYSEINYTSYREKVGIICKKHGKFFQSPFHHLNSTGCIKCKLSLGEIAVMNWLDDNFINYECQKMFPGLYRKQKGNLKSYFKYDFFLPEHNILIEYDGIQHFEVTRNLKFDFEKIKANDEIKNKYAIDNDINLLRIKYSSFNDIPEILMKYISSFKNSTELSEK